MKLLDYWQKFSALPYSDDVLIVCGALLLMLGVVKIVKSSFTMFFWVVLSAIGLTSIAHGFDQNPFQMAKAPPEQVTDVLDAGREMSADVLQVLCRKLDESQFGVPVEPES